MKRLLVVLLLVSLFTYSYAGQEKDRAKVVIIDPEDSTMIYDWPLWLFNHGYTSSYDSNWMDDYYYTRRRPGAIVVRQPPSFLESFLDGFGKGISKSADYYYRRKEQERYTKTMLKLLESPPVPKYTTPNYDEMSLGELIAIGLKKGFISDPIEIFKNFDQPKEYKMSSEERQANRERIIELDRIIKLKKERARLDKLFREAGWLDKDRIEYLDKYYPLPHTEGYPPLPEGYRLVRPRKKEEDDLTKYMKSIGAVRSWQYKTEKLNEYLKSLGLSLVPGNVDVNQVFDGEWVIYWDGEKWARKKKQVNHENP